MNIVMVFFFLGNCLSKKGLFVSVYAIYYAELILIYFASLCIIQEWNCVAVYN